MIIKLNNRCIGCGMCCSAIIFCISTEDIIKRCGGYYDRWKRGLLSDEAFMSMDDMAFAAVNWTEISRERAVEINPYLIRTVPNDKRVHYYTCRQFDSKTKKCALHGTSLKPQICTQYPVYGLFSGLVKKYYDSQYSPICGWNLPGDEGIAEEYHIDGVVYKDNDYVIIFPDRKFEIEDARCGC